MNAPRPDDEAIERRLSELVSAAVPLMADLVRAAGLRDRILTLPVVIAMILSMVWRSHASFDALVKDASTDGLLWLDKFEVSVQALSKRLRTMPHEFFRMAFEAGLPLALRRAIERSRPLSPEIARIAERFTDVWIMDGSTLEEIFKKSGCLADKTGTVLGGKMFALLDGLHKLPVRVWLDENPDASDLSFVEQVKELLRPGMLLLFDRGFRSFPFYDWLSERGVWFITRPFKDLNFECVTWLVGEATVRDRIVRIGLNAKSPCAHLVRLVEIQTANGWHRYLTNVLDPRMLSPVDVATAYAHRWRVEEAFFYAKRLFGLSYLRTDCFNGIALQVWATWMFFVVLIDLCDAVAEELDLPLDCISVEMVFKNLYFYSVSHAKGDADEDVVDWMAARPDWGVVKRIRRKPDPTTIPSPVSLS